MAKLHEREQSSAAAIYTYLGKWRGGDGSIGGAGEDGNLQVLSAERDAGGAVAGDNDVVHETGEGRDAPDEEGGHGAPIGGEFRRVAVHAVEVVHVRHAHAAAAHDVVVGHED
jgi:hypothetical protein